MSHPGLVSGFLKQDKVNQFNGIDCVEDAVEFLYQEEVYFPIYQVKNRKKVFVGQY